MPDLWVLRGSRLLHLREKELGALRKEGHDSQNILESNTLPPPTPHPPTAQKET